MQSTEAAKGKAAKREPAGNGYADLSKPMPVSATWTTQHVRAASRFASVATSLRAGSLRLSEKCLTSPTTASEKSAQRLARESGNSFHAESL